MRSKNKTIKILFRLFFWLLYLFAGVILYLNKFFLYKILLDFSKFIYPLSVFWLQIRINNKEPWLKINRNMTTSQLWFNLLPVLFSLFTFIITSLNLLFFVINLFI